MRKSIDYNSLYQEVKKLCQKTNEKINLVGLSLGGLLALHYGVDFPKQINSLILINPQFKLPKLLLTIQNIFLKLIPQKKFEITGFTKENFINIANSVKQIDLSDKVKNITCKVLIISREKDKINRKASKELHQLISHSELLILSNSEHESNIDSPKELSLAINKFINMNN